MHSTAMKMTTMKRAIVNIEVEPATFSLPATEPTTVTPAIDDELQYESSPAKFATILKSPAMLGAFQCVLKKPMLSVVTVPIVVEAPEVSMATS